MSKDIPSEGKAKVLLFRRDFLLFGTVVYNIWAKRVGDLDYESINFSSKVRYNYVTETDGPERERKTEPTNLEN